MPSSPPAASYACSLAPARRDARSASRHIKRALTDLTRTLHRAPEGHEIATAMGMSEAEYRDTLNRIASEETPEFDFLDLEEAELEVAIAQLPKDTQNILALLYQEGCSYDEIGAVLSMPPARAVTLHTDAIHRVHAMIVVARATEMIENTEN